MSGMRLSCRRVMMMTTTGTRGRVLDVAARRISRQTRGSCRRRSGRCRWPLLRIRAGGTRLSGALIRRYSQLDLNRFTAARWHLDGPTKSVVNGCNQTGYIVLRYLSMPVEVVERK